jgi:hypothetical protein
MKWTKHWKSTLRRIRRAKLAYAWKRCDIHTGLWSENLDEGDNFGNTMSIGGKMAQKNLKEIRYGDVDWVHLAQDTSQ